MATDALRIKIRKRINPNQPDHQSDDSFYLKNDGNQFFALSHFTDFFIDRVSNKNYMGKGVKDYAPASPNHQNSYTLQDLILPPSNRLGSQSNYEVQFLFLSYSVTGEIFYPIDYEGEQFDQNEKIENLDNDDFKCIMISGIKFKDDINGEKEKIEDQFKFQLNPYLKSLVEKFKIPLAFDIRSSLGFGDYCIITRATNFNMLMEIYHEINKALLSDYDFTKSVDEYNFDLLKYIYTIPGVNKVKFDPFVEDWNNKTSSIVDATQENESVIDTKMPKPENLTQNPISDDSKSKDQLPEYEKSSIHLFSKYSQDLEFFTTNFPKNKVFFVLGNYDLLVLDKLVSSEIISKSWRSKSRLIFDLGKNREYYLKFCSSKSNSEIIELFWEDFNNIKKFNDSIGFLDQKRVLTNIHILSLEYHINLFNRHKKENSICKRLLDEWESILKQLIEFTKIYLVFLTNEKANNNGLSNHEFFIKYYVTINNLRDSFQDTLRLINRSVRHWVIGSKSHIEFAGSENIFHFGNTAKIYNVYTKIFDEIQEIFERTSTECKTSGEYITEPEKLNFFLVPDNQIRTTSTILFPALTPDFDRLISINLSTEIIFNFKKLGLMMHEIGQFICSGRSTRNHYIFNFICREITNSLLEFVFPNPQADPHNPRYLSPLEKLVYINTYRKIFTEIKNLIISKTEPLFRNASKSGTYSIFLSPMRNFSKYIHSVFLEKLVSAEFLPPKDIDGVLEKSIYFHDRIDIEDKFWDKIIDDDKSIDDKNKNDILSILLKIPDYSEKELLIKKSIPIFIKYREKLKSVILPLRGSAKDDFKNKDFMEKYFSIDLMTKEEAEISLLQDLYKIRKSTFKNFNRVQNQLGKNKNIKSEKVNEAFRKLEDKIAKYLKKYYKNNNISIQEIGENEILGKTYFEYSNLDIDSFQKTFEKYFDFGKPINKYQLLGDQIDDYSKITELKNSFFFEVFVYITHLYIYQDEDFYYSINKTQHDITCLLRSSHLLSGDTKDHEILIKELKQILTNKRAYNSEKNLYLDQKWNSLASEEDLIQETKADFFMIRVLELSIEDYIEQYISNSDPSMEFDKFNKQFELRLDILQRAKAFDHSETTKSDDISEIELYDTLAKVIIESVNPVLKHFKDSKIMKACCTHFHQETPGISHDLEFIKTILQTEVGKGIKDVAK